MACSCDSSVVATMGCRQYLTPVNKLSFGTRKLHQSVLDVETILRFLAQPWQIYTSNISIANRKSPTVNARTGLPTANEDGKALEKRTIEPIHNPLEIY